MKWWKAFLCWLRGHDHQPIIDCDARRSFNRCTRCGHEFQYDFQVGLGPDFFASGVYSCPLCFGWKPKDWDRCANEICSMNPNGMLHRRPDGSMGYDLDSRQSRS